MGNRRPAGRFVRTTSRGPAEAGHVDAGALELYAFGFEDAALKRAVGFGDEEASAGADDAVPRDALSTGASGHGVADGARASGEAKGAREFAVGGDATTRNFLDQAIDGLPGHGQRLYRRDAEDAEKIYGGESIFKTGARRWRAGRELRECTPTQDHSGQAGQGSASRTENAS